LSSVQKKEIKKNLHLACLLANVGLLPGDLMIEGKMALAFNFVTMIFKLFND
jgi:hypothetical protein